MSKIVQVAWVMLLIGAPAALYFWYVSAQRQRINELHQRELGRAAHNLESVIENTLTTVERNLIKKVAEDSGYVCTFVRNQPYLGFPGDNCEEFKAVSRAGREPGLQRASRGLQLLVGQIGLVDSTQQERRLAFDVLLGVILDEVVVTDAFEYLFLADETGNVVFQTRRGERKQWDDQSRWLERQARGRSAEPAEALRLRDVSKLPLTVGGKAVFTELRRASSLARVRLAGSDYQLFLHPVRFAAGLSLVAVPPPAGGAKPSSDSARPGPPLGKEEAPGSTWVLGGLVPASRTAQQVLAVSPLFTLVLILFLGLGLITWPLVKFATLAQRERFRFADLCLLLGSTSALLIVITVLLLDYDAYRRFDGEATRGLEKLTDQIAGDIAQEFSRMCTQLVAFDKAMSAEGKKFVECEGLARAPFLLAPPDKRPAGEGMVPLPTPTTYEHVRHVFWIKPDGFQIAKGTIHGAVTARVNLRERAYFREAARGHLWSLAIANASNPAGGEPPDFFVQSYRSLTTGEFETSLSIRSALQACEATDDSPVVAVLSTDLASVRSRALPSGYGFMLIDRGGRVLYHSDGRRAGRENLFDEVSDPSRLRAAVLSGGGRSVETAYRAREHQFYLRPLKEVLFEPSAQLHAKRRAAELSGWFVVSFRDLLVPRTVNGEAIVSAFVWSWVYLLFFQLVPALLYLVVNGRKVQWLWPDGAKGWLYRRLTIHQGVLFLGTLLTLMLVNGPALLAAAFASPLVAAAVGIWGYWLWKVRATTSRDVNRSPLVPPASWWRLSAVTLLWLLLGVLPAANFFKFTWTEEFGRLLRYEASHLHQLREDLDLGARDFAMRLKHEYAGLKDPALPPTEWTLRRAGSAVPEPFHNLPRFPEETEGRRILDLTDYKPVYNEIMTRLRYYPSDPRLVEQAGLGMSAGLFLAIGGPLLVVGLALWIRHVTGALFLADVDERPLDTQRVIEAIETSERSLFVVINSAGGARVIQHALGKLPLAPLASVNIGDQLLESASSRAVLDRLEKLVFEDQRRVVVISRIDPFAVLGGDTFSAPGEAAQPIPISSEAERRRWSKLLERFTVVPVGISEELLGAELPSRAEAGLTQPDEAWRGPFWQLWTGCALDEKLVLTHVAEEGLVNPDQRRTVLGLMRRGLLVLRPDLRVFNAAFSAFIREVRDGRQLAQWERPVGTVGWKQIRWGLAFLLVAIAVFLLSTQRASITPAVGFISTFTAAIGGVLKLASELSRQKQTSP